MIRKIQQDDIINAANALISTFAQPPWNETWSFELAQQRVNDLLCGSKSTGFVCVEDEKVVSCLFGRCTTYLHGKEFRPVFIMRRGKQRCTTYLHGKEFFIDEFYVVPECQQNGYGTLMLEYLQNECKKDNIKSIVLNTEHDYPAERFYIKNGFKTETNLIFMYKSIK